MEYQCGPLTKGITLGQSRMRSSPKKLKNVVQHNRHASQHETPSLGRTYILLASSSIFSSYPSIFLSQPFILLRGSTMVHLLILAACATVALADGSTQCHVVRVEFRDRKRCSPREAIVIPTPRPKISSHHLPFASSSQLQCRRFA